MTYPRLPLSSASVVVIVGMVVGGASEGDGVIGAEGFGVVGASEDSTTGAADGRLVGAVVAGVGEGGVDGIFVGVDVGCNVGGFVGLGGPVGENVLPVFSLQIHAMPARKNPLEVSQTTHPSSKLTLQQAVGPMFDPQ